MKPYYEKENITLYCGDCRDVLPHLDVCDLVVTDPPYNVGKPYGTWNDALAETEYAAVMHEIVRLCREKAANQAWVAPRYKMALWSSLLPDAHLVVIRRGARGPYRGGWSDQFETALIVGKPSNIVPDLWDDIRLKAEGYFFREETYGHPGYTPAAILARCINLLSQNSIIDPFCGTGTSLVIAKKQGIRAVGIEINPAYCDIAVRRLRQEVFSFEMSA